jgi:acyl-CoA thioester hydrolase
VKVAAVKKAELKPVPLPTEIYDMFKAYVTEPES